EPIAPLSRFVVNGPTMGTRFSAVFYAPRDTKSDRIGRVLADAVAEVDRQMSTWKPESDLMRFNRAPTGQWVELPGQLLTVLEAALEIGRASSGAFDIGVLDHIRALGFQGDTPDAEAVARLVARPYLPAHDVVVVDRSAGIALKRQPCAIDLSGIAKGYGVDRLAETLTDLGVSHFLVSIDGELRALGGKPDGSAWRVAVEQPDPEKREAAGVIELVDGAVATSGNYRHRRELNGRSYSHTVDPRTGRPITDDIYSATVRAPTCMEADAWATVVMVLGEARASPLLAARNLSAMTLSPDA
ncbi:MAG: FAD:protein FMN transferase, partial [Proteobacteria bacterium]